MSFIPAFKTKTFSALFGALTLLSTASIFAETTNAEGDSSIVTLDLSKVFDGSPVIYTVLGCFSFIALSLWLYSLLTLRLKNLVPPSFIEDIRGHVQQKRFAAALKSCEEEQSLSASVLASGLEARHHGPEVMIEAMRSEGKRRSTSIWQRISLLSDIAMISPMLGLLGTVLGMFYAFYDSNHTANNLATMFDGLGIAIGTTVAGLVVAILATLFHTTLKFRAVRLLNQVEDQTLSIGHLIEHQTINPTATP